MTTHAMRKRSAAGGSSRVHADLAGMTGLAEQKDRRATARRARAAEQVVLDNGLLRRAFTTAGGFRTTALILHECGLNLVDPRTAIGPALRQKAETSPSREARLAIDGIPLDIGLNQGFRYAAHRLDAAEGRMELSVEFSPKHGTWRGLELTLHYLLLEKEACTIKWLTLRNNRRAPVQVSACQPEALTLPVPESRWMEVSRTVYPMFHPRNPELQPFDYHRYDFSPEGNAPIVWVDTWVSRLETFGFTMWNDYVAYARGAAGIINPPAEGDARPLLPGSLVSCGRSDPQEVFSQYPHGPNVVLRPGETFESFKTYMTFFSGGLEDGGLSIRRATRRLCPWIEDIYLEFKHLYWPEKVSLRVRRTGTIDLRPLQRTIDQAAEVGFDYWQLHSSVWIQGFGTWEPRPEFPNGIRDLKAVADHVHGKGLKLALHVLGEIGQDFDVHFVTDRRGRLLVRDIGCRPDFVKRHPEMILQVADGKTSYHATCACNGWHDYRHANLTRMVEQMGVDFVDLDGNYYGDMCYARDHVHHSPEESQYHNWRLQTWAYRYFLEHGIELAAPDFHQSLFHGNREFPSFHAETRTHGDMYQFVRRLRECLHISTLFIPNTALKYPVFADRSLLDDEDLFSDHALLDHWLASLCAYGVGVHMEGQAVYGDARSRAIIRRWLAFVKRHAPLLKRDVVHLAYPTGEHIDAIAHVDPAGRGLLAAFNPSDIPLCAQLVLPAKYLGEPAALTMRPLRGGMSRRVRATKARFRLDVHVKPHGYAIYLLTAGQGTGGLHSS